MNMKPMEWIKFYPVFLMGGVILAGCGPSHIEKYVSPDAQVLSIKTIAVVPFQSHQVKALDPTLKSGQISPNAPKFLTDLFVKKLSDFTGYQVLSMSDLQTALSSVDVQDLFTSRDRIREFGEMLNVDGIVLGIVDIYEERQGGPYGVERPAAVGFVVQLIRPQNGVLLWEGSYYERQKSLLEDVRNIHLFFRRKGKWVTAKELAEYGAFQLLKHFPNPKAMGANHGDHSGD